MQAQSGIASGWFCGGIKAQGLLEKCVCVVCVETPCQCTRLQFQIGKFLWSSRSACGESSIKSTESTSHRSHFLHDKSTVIPGISKPRFCHSHKTTLHQR
uniref:Uncharacterized protein n=1 Tax=Sphaerodactylus townsendi TaxID=933632 RepID=A0ACB8EF49_9SAUR